MRNGDERGRDWVTLGVVGLGVCGGGDSNGDEGRR
jgi:hypothetical protein